MKQTRSKHEANVLNIHVHDVCSKFATCLFHRVNIPLLFAAATPRRHSFRRRQQRLPKRQQVSN